ncbi:Argininosuccinate lyase [Variovorax sp. SRS16]|uniref:Bug family tripartite tricarboxylate transporter substrate binding protein n=1 Tax=Variovorax sp. SRS16 TaxID=282217 RepID=UPI001315C740|nr:tripartite tricarboxylate transporter substrate binding protein [Variovorax sp. SRS16]VTU16817.1 Argininosuccinate lyase [Variovorax sp. SRS16]
MPNLPLHRRCLVAGAVLLGLCAGLHAQELPAGKTIRIEVITSPGGSADFAARLIAEKLQTRLKRSVIVENRVGAGGNLATEFVAKAEPDGSTLLLTSNNHNINPYLYKDTGYVAQRDFAAVAQVSRGPSVLVVNPKLPVRTLAEFVAYGKAHPKTLFYATYGRGSAAQLAGEMLKAASGVDMDHVAYKGAAPAMTDVMGGQVPAGILSLFSVSAHIKSGALRPIAVFSRERSAAFPDVPTAVESGYPSVSYDIWLGILAPKATPAATVQMLNREIRSILTQKDASEKLQGLAMTPVDEPPAAFESFLKSETATIQDIVTRARIEAE